MATDLIHFSKVITALRFPLIVLVVLIHVPLAEDFSRVISISDVLDNGQWYYYVSKAISFVLGQAAVPAFFLFSGYYFFFKEQNLLDLGTYRQVLLKKAVTLLVPYLIWSFLPFLLEFAKTEILSLIQGNSVSEAPRMSYRVLYEVLWLNSYNFALWYVRDLLVLTCLSPLFYLLAKRFPYALSFYLFCIYQRSIRLSLLEDYSILPWGLFVV